MDSQVLSKTPRYKTVSKISNLDVKLRKKLQNYKTHKYKRSELRKTHSRINQSACGFSNNLDLSLTCVCDMTQSPPVKTTSFYGCLTCRSWKWEKKILCLIIVATRFLQFFDMLVLKLIGEKLISSIIATCFDSFYIKVLKSNRRKA